MTNCFVTGAISPDFIANCIANYQSQTQTGAHQIFIGQVRNDLIEGKEVQAIDYSANEAMANKVFHEIKAAAFEQFDLNEIEVYHSLGRVEKGTICLLVIVTSKRRKEVMKANEFVVEAIKAQVPVFGKEVFEDETHVWKVNS